MTENKHATEAAAFLAVNPGEYEIEKSKALATLALAYEQRTANLIAAFDQLGDGDGASYLGEALGVGNGKKLAEAILERLDLA